MASLATLFSMLSGAFRSRASLQVEKPATLRAVAHVAPAPLAPQHEATGEPATGRKLHFELVATVATATPRSPDSTGHLFLLLFFQFSFFLLSKLSLFLLFPFSFIFFPLITHICFSLL